MHLHVAYCGRVPWTTPILSPSSSRMGPCSMCSSKWAANGFDSWDAGSSPRYPILSSSCNIVFASPWCGVTSARSQASWMGTAPAQTPDDTAILGNRAPSSLCLVSSGQEADGKHTLSSLQRQYCPLSRLRSPAAPVAPQVLPRRRGFRRSVRPSAECPGGSPS